MVLKIALRQIYALFLALDLLLSALTGGAPLETISARLAIYRRKGCPWAVIAAGAVDWVALKLFGEASHCDSSLAAYEARNAAASAWSG